MKTILVDDMLLDLQLFELKCADMPDFEIVGKFTDPNEAIEYASGHVVDFALLDIDMPGMNGIELAQELRRLRNDIIIVFATAHPRILPTSWSGPSCCAGGSASASASIPSVLLKCWWTASPSGSAPARPRS